MYQKNKTLVCGAIEMVCIHSYSTCILVNANMFGAKDFLDSRRILLIARKNEQGKLEGVPLNT